MIDLSENTNRWGIPPAARRVLANPPLTSAYPEADALSLRGAIAEFLSVTPQHIVCGCGSDDVLDAAISALALPGDRMAIPEPTFRMVPMYGRARGLDMVGVAPRPDLSIDVGAIAAARPRLIYLASPNNPTGIATSVADVERLLRETPATVIVDEAYVDFEGGSALDLLHCSSRLLIVRTFSKAFGMAALRVGYGVAAPELIARIAAVRGPYQVNGIASAAAIAVLEDAAGDGVTWVRRTARAAVESRDRLSAQVRALGMRGIASRANFVLAPVNDAAATAAAMRDRDVLVRAFAALPGIGDAIRITAGTAADMDIALPALAAAVEGTRTTRVNACA